MTLLQLPQVKPVHVTLAPSARVLLIGNPNAGKTALFNKMTGLRSKTANYPGITVDLRAGRTRIDNHTAIEMIDLPGLYSLEAATPEERVAEQALRGRIGDLGEPDLVLLVLDATNLERNLFLSGQVLEMGLPTVIALNLMDAARAAGIKTDIDKLSQKLSCPVVPVSARTGEGIGDLRAAIAGALKQTPAQPVAHAGCTCTSGCGSCPFAGRYEWAEQVAHEVGSGPIETHGRTTAAIDRLLTHPVAGVAAFLAVMMGVFYLIFSIADVPMTLIETGVGWLGDAVGALLPAGDFRSLIVDGIIAGVGGVIVFLPQICILFFFITLLEDSGYLARAAFVMERLMRRVGLPGKAFVPMLSAHACAIPGIMAARVIEDRRDRLVTILVLPLLSCSARLPVYTMIAALLFAGSPGRAALMFMLAYMLGIAAALLTALALKKTVLRGETAPLVLELPSYRLPSLRNALMTMYDRAMIFIRRAGTIILLISIVLWALANYPKMPDNALPPEAARRVTALEARAASGTGDTAEAAQTEADQIVARAALAYSFAGRLGRAFEPVFRPLGFDWQINVGVLSSFAAREVIVSTLSIVYGLGDQGAEDEQTLVSAMRKQHRPDGAVLFSTATCMSLLVFYVLAMQCLPTQVVTRRETGSWKWALLQLGYMTGLAYCAALVTFQVASAMGLA